MAYKCTNGKKCSIAREKFGLTKKFGCAGFIMPDGKMIDLCFKKGEKEKAGIWADKHEHYTIGNAYGKTSFEELECFMKKCKAIRFRKQGKDGVIRVQAFTKPTSKQIDAVKKAVDEGCSRFVGYAGMNHLGVTHESETGSEAAKLDVMKWVNKGW